MSDDIAYVSGAIHIHPAVSQGILACHPFDNLINVATLFVEQADDGTYSEIKVTSEDNNASMFFVIGELEQIILMLGAGHTYSDYLTCYDIDDRANQWRISVSNAGVVIREQAELLYPSEVIPRQHAGALTNALNPEEIERALSTFAAMWRGDNDFSERQREVADRLVGVWLTDA